MERVFKDHAGGLRDCLASDLEYDCRIMHARRAKPQGDSMVPNHHMVNGIGLRSAPLDLREPTREVAQAPQTLTARAHVFGVGIPGGWLQGIAGCRAGAWRQGNSICLQSLHRQH